MSDFQLRTVACLPPHRWSIAAATLGLGMLVCGCESSEVGSVPKLPPRSEIQKQAEFPALKAGAKPSKGQLRGADKNG